MELIGFTVNIGFLFLKFQQIFNSGANTVDIVTIFTHFARRRTMIMVSVSNYFKTFEQLMKKYNISIQVFLLCAIVFVEIWTNVNNRLYSTIRCLCFLLILLPDAIIKNKLQFEEYFVLFTFVNENLIFFKSNIEIYAISRYMIAIVFILHYLWSQLSQLTEKAIEQRSVASEEGSRPIFLRYWQSISKLASFIWPSNNIRLQLCLAACAVLLILGRVTALLAPIYGKKVGTFILLIMSIPLQQY